MKLIERFERKFPRFGIPNLALHLVIITGAVMASDYIGISLSRVLTLDASLVFAGQVWRLVTFIFVVHSSNPIFDVLLLVFIYFAGRQLEAAWGTCKFNLYFIVSILATVIVAVIFPAHLYDGYYINMCLSIAFAALYPDLQLMYMMIIPLKAKYLMWVLLGMMAISIFQSIRMGMWSNVFAMLAALSAPALYCGGGAVKSVKAYIRRMKYKRRLK